MKLLSALILLIIAFGCSVKKEASSPDLRKTIEAFNHAFVAGDTIKLAELITADYVHTNSSWKSFGKEKWLSYMVSRRKKIDSGILEVHTYEMDEYAVEQYENTAIVTARITSTGTENGIEFNKQFRVTNLWIYDGSHWLRAGFHDTLIE
ncbi:nuclear transport factor 2 family protein [Ekhidna sp. To15]|uniref:nuclear transport factor 2 family protein n=1 Tax=Ekhidna sp. To15 TaxID=3395267 RepID=UPI003F52151E